MKKKFDTPKEKAIKIINRYRKTLRADNKSWEIEVKRSALIAVDIILKDVGAEDWENDNVTNNNYWQEVYNEITAV